MDQQVKKSQKRTKLIIALVAGILVLAAAVGALLFFLLNPADADIPEEGAYQLYWNLDREQYAGQAADGMTSREKDEDGYYNIRLAYRGKTVTRRTDSREFANLIDSNEIVGLNFKDGIITEVLMVNEFTGGYSCEGMRTYVTAIEGDKIVAMPSRTGDKKFELTMDKNTNVYDVSGETTPVGGVTTLRKDDQFLAVQNKRGIVTDIFVISRADLGNIRYAYCDHCKEEVKWIGWEKVTVLPAADSGHYFLMNDITAKAQTSIQADTEIILDLNGKTIQGKEDNRVFSLHNQGCYLAIMDYSEEQTGQIIAGESLLLIHQGACVWVRYGVFELYGGTLDASAAYSVNNGAAVCVPKDSVFNMYGGTITGGTISTKFDPSTQRTSAGMGGNVYVAGTFNMYDGLITKGKAESYYFRDTGTYTNGLGGNVFVAANATFNMTGGELRGGIAHGGGGNVFVNAYGTFNMSGDAKITGGKTIRPGKNGGSVYIAAKGVLNMESGTIDGGATTNRGGNMVLYGILNMSGGSIVNGRTLDADLNESLADYSNIFVVNGEMNMSGGYINGHVYLQNTTTGIGTYNVNLSGTAQIKDAAEGYANLYIRGGHPIHVGDLTDGAEIHVTASGKFTTETAAANKKYFHLDYPDVGVVHYENCLFAGRMGCVCGTQDGKHFGECDGTQIAWGAWSSKNGLPTTSGNYYLLYDVALRGQQSVSNEATIALDLNGKTVQATTDGRIYSLHATEAPVSITLTDSSKDQSGKVITASVETKNEGLLFWLRRSTKPHTLTIYGGTYDASGVVNLKNGAAIHATDGSTINIHGGTIIGGTAKSTWSDATGGFSAGRGGTIYTTGYLNMTGGTITGGKAVYTSKDVQTTTDAGITSVVTKNGDAYGGNIVLVSKAVANFTGGTIEGGNAGALGGNIYIGNQATATFAGVTIKDGTAARNGGNVYMGQQSRITMTGGKILGGQNTAEGANGGSIYICGSAKYGDAIFVMKDGLVSDGKSMNMGGNFDVRGSLQIEGGEIKGGMSLSDKTDQPHSNVAIVNLGTDTNNGKLVMTGGHIHGGVNSQTALGLVFSCITVSGDAEITAPEGYLGVSLRGDAHIKIGGKDLDDKAIGGLTEGAQIWVNQTVGRQVAATGTDTVLTEADTAYFKHETGNYTLREDGMIYLERTVEVSTAQQLHDALEAGYSVILKNDIKYDASKIVDAAATTEMPGIINVRNRIVLDMRGFTVTYTPAADTNPNDGISAANKFINLMGNAEITITGDGKIRHEITLTDEDNGAMFRVAAGTLTIENGTFERVNVSGSASQSVNRYLFWNGGSGRVNILGGTFSNYGTREISEANNVSITGGKFLNNPANYGLAENYGASVQTVDGKTWWVVEPAVKVGTAQQLHDALQAGKSVILEKDIAYNAADIKDDSVIRKVTQIIFNSGSTETEYYAEAPGIIQVTGYVTLNLNGHTVTYTPAAAADGIPVADKFFNIPSGARLTVTGEGTIKHQVTSAEVDNASTFRVDAKGILVIENGSFVRSFAKGITAEKTVRFIIRNNPNGSAVQIDGGSFNNVDSVRAISGVSGVTITGGTFDTDPTGCGVADGYYVAKAEKSFTVMAPVAVEDAQQLHDALQAGKSVILMNDITYTCAQITDSGAAGESAGIINVTGNVTLDMNGYTVTYIPDGKADKFINLTDGSALKVTGEGTLVHMITSANGENGATFRVAAGTLTVVNGTFQRTYADGISAEAKARAIVWDSNKGVAYIEGGMFANTSACVTGKGAADGITGGAFNTDPTSGLAFAYQVKEKNGIYTVTRADKSTVLEVDSAQKLHDALEAGYSVKLTADIDYLAEKIADAQDALIEAPGIINATGQITLDMNGHVIRYTPAADPDTTDEIAPANKFINLTLNCNLTITGNGRLTHNVCLANSDNGATFRVAAGTLNIKNGTFERVFSGIDQTSGNRWIFWNGGSGVVNISGGSFSSAGIREIYDASGVTITAGWFASNPMNYGLADGYGVAKDTDLDGKRWYVVKPAVDVGTAQELHDALQAGLSVNLTGDIAYIAQNIVRDSLDSLNSSTEAASIINIGGYVTLNMNGHTITYTPASGSAANKFINMTADTGLTVTGNGTIVHEVPYTDTDNGATFRVAAGELIIKDGITVSRVYTGGNTNEQTSRYIFWDGGNSKLVIEGGTFTNAKTNCVCGEGKNTVITGGKFNTDPTGRGVADGHMVVNVTENGLNWYKVEKPVFVNSAQALHDALQSGKGVILTADIAYISAQITDSAAAGEAAGIINVTGKVGLNLNGHTITYTPDGEADKFINLTAGAELTVLGNGMINHLITDAQGESGTMFRVDSGILTVKNGVFQRYYAEGITAEADARPVIWDSGEGAVYVLDGNFYNASAACIDGSGKVAGVSGGIFNTDPSQSVAFGYKTVASDGIYTVTVLGASETVTVNNAEQLKQALEEGRKAILGKDITYDLVVNIACSGDPQLDLNGHTITWGNNTRMEVYDGCVLTIGGNGAIVQNNGDMFRVSATGALVINGGTYTASGRIIFAGGNAADSVTINGGTFNGNITCYSGTLTITGGRFANPLTTSGATCAVTGGYFKADPSACLTSNCVAVAYTESNGETWYEVYAFTTVTTPEELKAALEAGKNVMLQSDITYDVSAHGTINMGSTTSLLHLNSCKVTFDTNGAVGPIIKMNGTNLTVMDSGATQTGSVEVRGTQNADLFELTDGVLTVNTGTFTNETDGQIINGISGAVVINGGKYNKKLASAAECPITCKPGHILMIPNGESMYTLVERPADATPVSNAATLKQALERGEKAWLVCDIAINNDQPIDIANSAVLDLNGFTITVTNTVDGQPMFQQRGNTILTVRDGSAAKNGAIKAVVATNGISSDLFSVGATDTLNVEGGKFVYAFADGITAAGTSSDFIHAAGTVNVSGGSFGNKVGGNIYTVESTGAFKLRVGYVLKDDDNDGVWTVEALVGVGVNTAEDLKTNLMNGTSVYLTGNIEATWEDSECIAISGKTVTLDLNGFTINHAPAFTELNANGTAVKGPAGTRLFNLLGGTVLTTKDSYGGGVIQTTARMTRVNTGTTWNAEGGTYKCLTSGQNVVFWSSANVSGGSFSQNPATFLAEGCGSYLDSTTGLYVVVPAEQTANSAADLRNKLQGGCTVKLTGDINYTLSDAIQIPAGVSATLDLNGYTISHTGGVDRLFALLAGGSTVEPSNLTVKDSSNGLGAIESTQKAVFRVNTQATYGDAKLYIEGGRLSCTGAVGIFWSSATELTGGVYNKTPAAFVASGYETVGPSSGYYAVVKTVNSTTVEVRSAWEMKVALECGKNVVLAADVNTDWEDSLSIAMSGKTVSLDLNGHSIVHTPALTEKTAEGTRLFNLLNGTEFTLKDSVGGGCIETRSRMIRVNDGTKCNVQSGIYKSALTGNYSIFYALTQSATNPYTITVTGGSFTQNPASFTDANNYKVTGPVNGLYTVAELN